MSKCKTNAKKADKLALTGYFSSLLEVYSRYWTKIGEEYKEERLYNLAKSIELPIGNAWLLCNLIIFTGAYARSDFVTYNEVEQKISKFINDPNICDYLFISTIVVPNIYHLKLRTALLNYGKNNERYSKILE